MNQSPTPPRWADRLLRLICAPDRLEEVQGDLYEEFAYQVGRVGERRARWRYGQDVLGFLKDQAASLLTTKRNPTLGNHDTFTSSSLFRMEMIRTYFAIAFRQLWKNQLFSIVNIVGLTVGLAVSTFIALYVWHEFHYDRFEPLANRTYRVLSVSKFGSDEVTVTGLHESFGRSIQQQIPDVEQVVRWSDGMGSMVLQSDDKHRFKEEKIGFADASFLPVLGFKVLRGDPKTALNAPGRIVLTRRLAEKYFGDQNPIGKTLMFDKHFPLTVSAVLDDLPTNSVIGFNGLVSLSSMPALGPNQQGAFKENGFLMTYLVLRPEANVSAIEKKLQRVKANIKHADKSASYFLEPLSSLHLDSRSASKDTRQTLYLLLTIALIILTLATINYVSLTTARATKRAKEVGIRKAIGGQRHELVGQFFLESFLSTTLAFALSLALLQALFPWANNALDLHMDNRILAQGPYWGLMLALWLGCSLLAGGYPALFLSGFRPALVLKGTTTMRYAGAGMRQIFTTVQFTACVGLLICSIVLYSQMKFLRSKKLGINREQVVALYVDSDMASQFPALRDTIRQWAGPDNVATTNTRLFSNQISLWFLETAKTKKQLMVNAFAVDKSFFDMMGVHWQYRPVGWETGAVTKDLTVYNQTLMKEAGIVGNPFQQAAPIKDQPASGVVSDFHILSLHGPISPMQLTVVSDTNHSIMANGGYLLVRLKPKTDIPEVLTQLKVIYDHSRPSAPFDYYFLDEAYDKLYFNEERLARLFNGFTALTLLVACLGLLGLMTFSVEARTKEIGVRKVLGASVTSIVTLLSINFIKLIVLATLLASPLAWYVMETWLQKFAYKIDIAWWIYALAGGLVAGVALLTVGFQSIKAALANPVHSLRSE